MLSRIMIVIIVVSLEIKLLSKRYIIIGISRCGGRSLGINLIVSVSFKSGFNCQFRGDYRITKLAIQG
jgi:hypothetical protein